jgi:hypothetical protein
MRLPTALAPGLLAGFVLSGSATAEGLEAAADALADRIAQHAEEGEDAALVEVLDDVVALHERASDDEQRAEVNGLFGAVLRATRNEGVEKAVLEAIGRTGDEANWRYVRPYLRQPDPKEEPPLLVEAIETAGEILAPGAIDPLLRIARKSKTYPAAAAAIRALGSYGSNERSRARILEEIVETVRKSVPGGRGMQKGGTSGDGEGYGSTYGGRGDASRWSVLAPALVEAANRLTGREAATAEDWFEIVERYEGRLDDVFER